MKKTTILAGCLLAVLLAGSVAAQAPAGPAAGTLAASDLPGLKTRLSLDLKEPMEVADFLKFLAMKGGLNIVIGSGVSGTVKLLLEDVTVADALEIVLSSNRLAYEIQGRIIKVMSSDEYQRQNGVDFYDRKVTRILSLKNALPSRVAPILEQIRSAVGKIVFDDQSGTLVLIDTPEKVAAMEAVVDSEDRRGPSQTVTRIFTLQHARVDDLTPEIQPHLTDTIGRLQTSQRTKTLIVTDFPHVVERIGEIIETFDRKSRQVFIEARIVQVALDDSYSLGINWEHLFQAVDPRFSLATSVLPGGPLAEVSGGRLNFRTIAAGGDLQAILRALESMGKANILSNPHIAVIDGEEAVVKVVQNQPYAEKQFESGTTNLVGYTYQFVEIGVLLSVRPRISENGFINVAIRPEVSEITTWYDPEAPGIPQRGVPVVQRSYSETTVDVMNGTTIIISGMIKEEQVDGVSQVPFFGRIPLLGVLFRSKEVRTKKVEIVVFLTPRLVEGDEGPIRAAGGRKSLKTAADADLLDRVQ